MARFYGVLPWDVDRLTRDELVAITRDLDAMAKAAQQQ